MGITTEPCTILSFRSATPSKKTIKKQESKKVLMAKELPALTKDIIKKWNSQSTKVSSVNSNNISITLV